MTERRRTLNSTKKEVPNPKKKPVQKQPESESSSSEEEIKRPRKSNGKGPTNH